MRYLVRRTLLLTLFFCFSSFCISQSSKSSGGQLPPPPPDYNPEAWREFTSAGGRFSVLLPGSPRKKISQIDVPNGKIDSHTFTLRLSNQSPQYDLMYFDLPEGIEIEDSKAAFDNVRDDGVKAVEGKLLEEREDNRIGYPSRFYKVQTKDGHMMRIKAFIVKNRFYNLSFTTAGRNESAATARLHDETATKFLDSFRLLSAEELTKFEGEVDRMLKDEKVGVVIARGSSNSSNEPATTPKPIISGGVLDAKAVAKPQPVYPEIARAARAQGTVVVKVLVDEEGKVIAAQVESGHPLLQQAAVKAAREARFSPTYLNRKPVKLLGTIFYNFILK